MKIILKLLVFVLMSMSAFQASASAVYTPAQDKLPNAECCTVYQEPDYIHVSFESEKRHFTKGENIVVSYTLANGERVSEVKYNKKGFSVKSVEINPDNPSRVDIEVSVWRLFKRAEMSLEIHSESGKVGRDELYALRNEHGSFISDNSASSTYHVFYYYMQDINPEGFELELQEARVRQENALLLTALICFILFVLVIIALIVCAIIHRKRSKRN